MFRDRNEKIVFVSTAFHFVMNNIACFISRGDVIPIIYYSIAKPCIMMNRYRVIAVC